MQAHFEEKITFFLGEKSIKFPVLQAQFEEKIHFLGMFVVKTHWIIGQKSQNNARYGGAFKRKKIFFFWEKSQYSAL